MAWAYAAFIVSSPENAATNMERFISCLLDARKSVVVPLFEPCGSFFWRCMRTESGNARKVRVVTTDRR